jgi:hypothetical protein
MAQLPARFGQRPRTITIQMDGALVSRSQIDWLFIFQVNRFAKKEGE